MANRPHPQHASNDPHNGPWTTCDRCGFIWGQKDMQFQWDFFGGATPQNTGYLVCPNCLDDLAYQYKLLILPPDPPPQFNIRPEAYAVDSTNFRIDEAGDTRVTEDGDNRIDQSNLTPTGNPAVGP